MKHLLDTLTHWPVLAREVIEGLAVEEDGIYIDATFGRGGHAKQLLEKLGANGTLLCLDRDREAITVAEGMKDSRMISRHGAFSNMVHWVEELHYGGKVSGVLMDLGVSSPQLDDAERGFSFLRDGPLDMRMDQRQPVSAAGWLRSAREEEIARVLRVYGEERFSGRIAAAIVRERKLTPIVTTARLATIVSEANPRWEKHRHPATRTFQAIRILINRELEELTEGLEQMLNILKVGGRLAVITFHSLEDHRVKDFVKKYRGSDMPDWVLLRSGELNRRIRVIGKTIQATAAEINFNPRARSAKLRVLEKLV